MSLAHHTLTLDTESAIAFHDITDAVRRWVRARGTADGLLTVTTPHTTARIVVNEADPALQRDMRAFLERLAPAGATYAHNADTVDDRANAHAHLLALLMPASETLAVSGGELALGRWQALFFVELDGPRRAREVRLHLLRP